MPVEDTSRRDADGPMVGLTGARFGGAAGRRSRKAAEPPEQTPRRRGPPSPRGPAECRAVRRPVRVPRWRHKQQDSAPQQAVPQPEAALPVSAPARVNEADWDVPEASYNLVRPYSRTGGRTASRVDLEVETLVSVTGRPADPAALPEHRTILELCATPHSVAELAALLSTPLGVARVLLGDMAAAGCIAIHRTVGSADAASDVALMERVLSGLQRL